MSRANKWGPYDVVAAFFVSKSIRFLQQSSILRKLAAGPTVHEIASEYGYDETLLSVLLEFVHQTSDILIRLPSRDTRSRRFKLRAQYSQYVSLEFLLDKFLGAYGKPFDYLDLSLRSGRSGRRFTEPDVLAAALGRVGNNRYKRHITSLIRSLRVNRVLDLGCGAGHLLADLSTAIPRFEGWGIDSNARMCRFATERLKRCSATAYVRILHANIFSLKRLLTSEVRRRIEVIYAGSLLNSLFGGPRQTMVTLIAELKRLFPNRLLIVDDYYGKLGFVQKNPNRYLHSLVHDLVQAFSGQGVPAPSLQFWRSIYRDSRCQLVHCYEGETDGLNWFVHLVQL